MLKLSIWNHEIKFICRLSICRLSICRLSICRLSICIFWLSICRKGFFPCFLKTIVECFVMYRYTRFYTAANVHFTIRQVLQIIHTSLAIEILS